MKSKVKYDIFYVKQSVRYLHEIFCVIFCHLFCVIFCEIFQVCDILLCIISRNILLYFCEYFTHFTYFTPGPNVSIIAHISQYCTLYFTAPVCRCQVLSFPTTSPSSTFRLFGCCKVPLSADASLTTLVQRRQP